MIAVSNSSTIQSAVCPGKPGILTAEIARGLAQQELAAVAQSGGPASARQAARLGMTIKEICDWYLTEADAGRLLDVSDIEKLQAGILAGRTASRR